MQKPGASPQGNAGSRSSAEGAKSPVADKLLLAIEVVTLAMPRLQRFVSEVTLSWGDAPGFCISRPWGSVERYDPTGTLVLLADSVEL
jgi:hypothetical protein